MIDVTAVLNALKTVLPESQYPIGLHEPHFRGNEWKYVKDCIDTRWVSSVGKYVDRFEEQLAAYTGVRLAVAVVNGTAALQICLKLAGVLPGDEVLVPTLTFVATVNAITYCGAIPHFVDSEVHTLGMDPVKLEDYLKKTAVLRSGECVNRESGRPIKAVLPMHTFGHPVDIDALVGICHYYNLILVEDAAESLGSFYKGVHTGNWGKLSALSFNGNKIITTGGGGAILTNDEGLGKLAKHVTTTAKLPHPWAFNHDMIGYNYRLPNINAALGCAQVEKLSEFRDKKRALAQKYKRVFEGISGIQFFSEPDFAESNYWLNVLLLDEPDVVQRDQLLEVLRNEGLKVRPAWTPMHKLPMFQDCPRMDLTVTESLEARLINLPSSAFL